MNDSLENSLINIYKRSSWSIRNIEFVNESVGYAVGNYGTLLKTEDGGKNWIEMPRVCEYDLMESTGFVAGEYGIKDKWTGDIDWESGIWRTDDGGYSWKQIFHVKGTRYIYQVYALSPEVVFALVNGDKIALTTDGGQSWSYISRQGKFFAYSIAFGTDGTGWLVGGGSFLTSTDGERTWKEAESVPKEIRDHPWDWISIGKSGYGVAVSRDGVVVYTRDDGRSWKKHSENFSDLLGKVEIYDKVGVIKGLDGVYRVEFK